MFKLLCVTNRRLVAGDFLTRIEGIAACSPGGIILREKDLSKQQYKELAGRVICCCNKYQVPCILHSFPDVAYELGAMAIHLPMEQLRAMAEAERLSFQVIGASCHSVDEAKEAQGLGAGYLIVGHIFATDCKMGLPPRGISCLQEICKAVSIPVYAIGGIDSCNVGRVQAVGAAGACIMSGPMKCVDVKGYFMELRRGYRDDRI